jgi:hypothetical protein
VNHYIPFEVERRIANGQLEFGLQGVEALLEGRQFSEKLLIGGRCMHIGYL